MSEIDGPKFSVNQINFKNVQKQSFEPEQEPKTNDESKIADFSDDKAETIGRSMLFKGTDDINNDLKTIVENPQIAENSDKIFEVTYAEAVNSGIANPYEEAASASTASPTGANASASRSISPCYSSLMSSTATCTSPSTCTSASPSLGRPSTTAKSPLNGPPG